MKHIFFTLIFLSFLRFCSPVQAQLIKNEKTLQNISHMLDVQKQLAISRSAQLFNVFKENLSDDERQCLEFLYAYMPLSDLADYDGKYYLEAVRSALKARKEMSWGSAIPEDIFLHFVLPVRVNNENLDRFRMAMYPQIAARVKGLSMKDAALEINHWCHEKVTYKGSDERTSSPLATIRTAWGRCGEESTFTVSALRAAGIPARQVYTPRWAHSDDNHAWVEVWVYGKWYFMGACEPEPDLNMGWFAEPSRRAMLVHTRAYGWYNGTEPVVMREDRFSELNLIRNYAPVKTFYVKVLDQHKRPVNNARVEYQLYNYSEFYPIAANNTNAKGFADMTTGLGDLIIWAGKANAWDYKKITVEKTDTVVLTLNVNHKDLGYEEYDLIPPVERTPREVSAAGKALNVKRLHSEDSIRALYVKTYEDPSWSESWAKTLHLNVDSTVKFIRASYGNWQEIRDFLTGIDESMRPWALHLLAVLSEKDLRDTRAFILRDHLLNGLKTADLKYKSDQDFFTRWVLCPRISNEMMVDWRGFLNSKFDQDFEYRARVSPRFLASWINNNIRIEDKANLHSRAPLTPRGVFELRVADKHSRDIFFVALCRSMSIPARLDQATSVPQFWNGKEWEDYAFEQVTKDVVKGFMHLSRPDTGSMPRYYRNFTLAHLSGGFFHTLEYDEDLKLTEFPEKLEVDTGKYMLVTGNRLSNGNILSSLSFFEVKPDQTTTVNVRIRSAPHNSVSFGQLDLTALFSSMNGSGGEKTEDAFIGTKGAVLIWIDPDKEPSKHVLADIPAVSDIFEKWGGKIIFFIEPELMSASFKPGNYPGLPSTAGFSVDPGNQWMKQLEKIKGRSLRNNYPYITVMDKDGRLFYYSEGYKIGIGEQLAKEINSLK